MKQAVLRQICDVCGKAADTPEGELMPKDWLTREKVDMCDKCIEVEKAGGGNVKSAATYLFLSRK